MKDIPDKSVDMILCDLPYGTTACKWDIVIPFEPLWGQYERIIKDNGAIVLFGSEPFSSALRMSNIKLYKYDWYWNKVQGTGFSAVKKQPMRVIETISVFYKKPPIYNPQMEKREKVIDSRNWKQNKRISENSRFTSTDNSLSQKIYDKKYPVNLLNINRASNECNNSKRVHPTQKPVALLEYLIKTYTNEGETVLDNCMGSGSTGVACVNTNRNFIGIELDDKYFEIAKERIESHKVQRSARPLW
jgi:site-specific DNA-methyltransferase (adenine-specific)